MSGKVVIVQGHVFDTGQVKSCVAENKRLRIVFANGDTIQLRFHSAPEMQFFLASYEMALTA